MQLGFQNYFKYLNATPTSRCVTEGEEVINAGHIILCGITENNADQIKIYSLCLQTSALNSNPHEIQGVLSTSDNLSINKMTCTCPAGKSGKCKHVSAVLIYCTRNDILEFPSISQTDLKCVWAYKKQAVIENYKSVPILDTPCFSGTKRLKLDPMSKETIEQTRVLLETACPNCALLKHRIGRRNVKIIDNGNETKVDEINYYAEILNNSAQSILMLNLNILPINLQNCCKSNYDELFSGDIDNILVNSKDSDTIWKKERKFRITGSRCYSIFTYKGINWEKKAFNYFWPKIITNLFVKHGLFYENNARNKYRNVTEFTIQETGLIVSNSNPWLANSPDGIIIQDGKPTRLLEIKCPYSGKNETIKSVLIQCKYLIIEEGKIEIKKKHQYYGQVQLGMALLNLPICDFVIYSSFDDTIEIIQIPLDQQFAYNMLKTIKEKYFKYMFHTICENRIK